MLPVIVGLILISVIFQSLNSNFLTAGNLVNLLVQGAVYMLLAMAEVFVLLLGEIDLSVGFVAGVGGVDRGRAGDSEHGDWPWWAAIGAALLLCAADRHASRARSSRGSGLPSFVVTLAGLLGCRASCC